MAMDNNKSTMDSVSEASNEVMEFFASISNWFQGLGIENFGLWFVITIGSILLLQQFTNGKRQSLGESGFRKFVNFMDFIGQAGAIGIIFTAYVKMFGKIDFVLVDSLQKYNNGDLLLASVIVSFILSLVAYNLGYLMRKKS